MPTRNGDGTKNQFRKQSKIYMTKSQNLQFGLDDQGKKQWNMKKAYKEA